MSSTSDWFFLSHRKEIALRARKAGYNVTIVTKDTGKKKEIEALGLKVIDLPMSRIGTKCDGRIAYLLVPLLAISS